MPTYEFYCDGCQHKYDSYRQMSKRDDPAPCPKCGEPGRRQITAFGYKYEGHYFMGSPTERRMTDPHQ